mmetsp:Transcript_74569/g.205614  ORF Transcript_74569/g.205614 Transcript_74569/m.205614 type:complete len:209 (-) Transcript_74569:121-747(-)
MPGLNQPVLPSQAFLPRGWCAPWLQVCRPSQVSLNRTTGESVLVGVRPRLGHYPRTPSSRPLCTAKARCTSHAEAHGCLGLLVGRACPHRVITLAKGVLALEFLAQLRDLVLHLRSALPMVLQHVLLPLRAPPCLLFDQLSVGDLRVKLLELLLLRPLLEPQALQLRPRALHACPLRRAWPRAAWHPRPAAAAAARGAGLQPLCHRWG